MNSINSNSAALLSAVKKGHYDQAQKLLNQHGLSRDDKWNDYKILIHAVHARDLEMVDLLLSHGCRVRSSKSNSCKTPLCYAVNAQNLEMVKILLNAGASITDKDSNVDTPLYMAAKNKFFTAVDLMLSKYDVDNIDVTNTDEIIHFYIVCIRNNIELFRSFIKCGMNVNTYVNFDAELWPGYSPLHFAVEHESVQVMELLLIYRANYTFLNAKKMSPLHLAFYLKNSEKKFTMISSILCMMQFRVYNANPVDNNGLSHFHIACTGHCKETVENFVKSGVIINSPTSDGCYPLHYAVRYGHEEVVEILLKYGANVNVKFGNSTPLHLAIKTKIPSIVKLLLTYGANVCTTDQNDCTPIHIAYYDLLNSYDILHSMMSVHQGNMMNVTDHRGLSIFHIACAVGDTVAVKNFLQRNVDVNACLGDNADEFSGFTGLHFAVMNFHEDVIKLLLKHKANVNAVDKNGRLAIWIATQFIISEFMVCQLNNNLLKGKSSYKEAGVSEEEVMNYMYKEVRKTPIIKLLVENQSSLYCTSKTGSPLFKAYNPAVLWKIKDSVPNKKFIQSICKQYNSTCRIEILEILIKTGIGFYALDKHHNSILHLFAQDPESNENLRLVRILITSGCNLDVINKVGKTALHLAANNGSIEYVKLLLKYKANPNCTDKNLSTPLHYVAEKDSINDHNFETPHTKILRLLIDKGANIDARNKNGCTPLFAAVQSKERLRALLCLLKADCQVNIFSKKEVTPLLLAARKNNSYAVKLLLDYGADINLTCKNQCSLLKRFINNFKGFDFFDLSFMETFKVFEMHIEKMRLIDYPVRATDLIYRKYLGIMLANRIFSNIIEIVAEKEESEFDSSKYDLSEKDNFITPVLRKELEKMKMIKIDGYTSLHDILFKNETQMVKHVKNEIFNEYLEDDNLHVEFQHYGFLLRLKYKEGMNRYVLLEPAKESFGQLIGQNLPDLCLDGIFICLSNEDLVRLTNVCV